jgi:DNA-binding transcriptional LysR family regulator
LEKAWKEDAGKMELRHIRYFKAVAEEKSFTKAAEQLAIAQPPLSRQIQDLEAELGTTLFLRTPHKVSLTEEGELFLQYANQILDLVNRSEEDVRERKEGLQGTLYIASVEGCGPRLFAEWIAGFRQKHPHVQYNLWNGNTDDVNNRVTKGLCEIAMITAPYNTEEFEVLPVYEELYSPALWHSQHCFQNTGYLRQDSLLPESPKFPVPDAGKWKTVFPQRPVCSL